MEVYWFFEIYNIGVELQKKEILNFNQLKHTNILIYVN